MKVAAGVLSSDTNEIHSPLVDTSRGEIAIFFVSVKSKALHELCVPIGETPSSESPCYCSHPSPPALATTVVTVAAAGRSGLLSGVCVGIVLSQVVSATDHHRTNATPH